LFFYWLLLWNLFPRVASNLAAPGEWKRSPGKMYRTIKRLFAASALLTLCSIASLYAGSRVAAAVPPAQAANPLAAQFGGDPGDGWMLAGGLLMLVALAFASAACMLWMREREGGR
jgi:hypothetical protein